MKAYKQKSVGVTFTPFRLGMTETLAPVSIKNDRREFLSVINRRYDVVVAPVPASSNAAVSFPGGGCCCSGSCMDVCIAEPPSRTCGGNNKYQILCGVECCHAVWGEDDIGSTHIGVFNPKSRSKVEYYKVLTKVMDGAEQGSAGTKVVTRNYVFRKSREYTEPDFGKKLDLLEFEIINDSSFPTDQKSKFIQTFSRLKSEMKSKWQTAKRTESVFLKKYHDWLQGTLEIPKKKINIEKSPGRPSKEFAELTDCTFSLGWVKNNVADFVEVLSFQVADDKLEHGLVALLLWRHYCFKLSKP
ncbi:hypothetical protein HW555_004392 [Spodoptera exigua]|uniref:Uncharacterized protein n=1 Tax=Spodoptera exigua TaxID=7107 RepID=A0A835GN84_SPOEX|nr:hypothetical protein HW555_004392 [Spodoptera exigua]